MKSRTLSVTIREGSEEGTVMVTRKVLEELGLFRGDTVSVHDSSSGKSTTAIALSDDSAEEHIVIPTGISRTLNVFDGMSVELSLSGGAADGAGGGGAADVQYATSLSLLAREIPISIPHTEVSEHVHNFFQDAYRVATTGDTYMVTAKSEKASDDNSGGAQPAEAFAILVLDVQPQSPGVIGPDCAIEVSLS